MAEGKKLSEDELFECLKAFNVPVRSSDLKTPSKDFIIRVFRSFLSDLQIDITSQVLKPWEAVKCIEYPEMYETAQMLMLLTVSVNQIMQPCGLDITIKDIIEPKPKRTKKILNFLIVFWNYFLKKHAHFRYVEDCLQEEQKKVDNLVIAINALEERCNEEIHKIKSMDINKEELFAQITEKENVLEQRNKQKDDVNKKYHDLKTEEANFHRKYSELHVNIASAKEKLEEFSQLILSSPERINSEMLQLKERIKEEDKKLKEMEDKGLEQKKKLKLFETSQNGVSQAVETVGQLSTDIESLSQQAIRADSTYQKVREEEEKCKKLQLELEGIEQKKLAHEQKMAKVNLTARKQMEVLHEVLKMNESVINKESMALESTTEVKTRLLSKLLSSEEFLKVISSKTSSIISEGEEKETEFYAWAEERKSDYHADCEETVAILEKTFED